MDRFNLLEVYDGEDFRFRFRFRKDSVIDLVNILDKDLKDQSRRGLPRTPMQQVPIALRLYAAATLERVIGDLFGVCVFQCMHSQSQAFKSKRETERTFPVILCYDVAHFQVVIGAIDCTHIMIICPNKETAMTYINRKQFYSISIQAACNSDAFMLTSWHAGLD